MEIKTASAIVVKATIVTIVIVLVVYGVLWAIFGFSAIARLAGQSIFLIIVLWIWQLYHLYTRKKG